MEIILLKKVLSVLCFFFLLFIEGCSYTSSEAGEFRIHTELTEYKNGCCMVKGYAENISGNSSVIYRIAEGTHGTDWFGCQGYTLPLELDGTFCFRISHNGSYTVYVKDSVGKEAVSIVTVKNINNDISNIIKTEVESDCNSIVISNRLNITGYAEQNIEKFTIYTGAKSISECVNNTDSNCIVAEEVPCSLTVLKNSVYTVFVETKNTQYADIYYITNIDEIKPEIVLGYSPDKENVSEVTISQSCTSGNGIDFIRWFEGKLPQSGIKEKGSVLKECETFSVTENGIYTVYAQDKYGLANSAVINISNISNSLPEIILALSDENITNQNIEITMSVDYKGVSKGIEKYAEGQKDAQWFITEGTEYTQKVSVEKNGIYTFYAENAEAHYSIKTIEIENIDKELPIINNIEYESANSLKELDIKVYAHDNTDIFCTVIAEGNCKASEIEKSYYIDMIYDYTAGCYTGKIFSNGTYTVGVRDTAGNWNAKIITVSNIDNIAPGVVSSLSAKYFDGYITLSWILPADRDIAGVKIVYSQNLDGSTEADEVCIEKNTSYKLKVNSEKKLCFISISIFDEAGNIGNGTVKTVEW